MQLTLQSSQVGGRLHRVRIYAATNTFRIIVIFAARGTALLFVAGIALLQHASIDIFIFQVPAPCGRVLKRRLERSS